MTHQPIDDLLDDPTPIPDGGFTRRVMAALPPARPASRGPQAWLVALVAGVTAAVLAPEAVSLARAVADGSAHLGGGLARGLAASGGALPVAAVLMAALLALGAAALGRWLVADPG
jgi:hypothetical protein